MELCLRGCSRLVLRFSRGRNLNVCRHLLCLGLWSSTEECCRLTCRSAQLRYFPAVPSRDGVVLAGLVGEPLGFWQSPCGLASLSLNLVVLPTMRCLQQSLASGRSVLSSRYSSFSCTSISEPCAALYHPQAAALNVWTPTFYIMKVLFWPLRPPITQSRSWPTRPPNQFLLIVPKFQQLPPQCAQRIFSRVSAGTFLKTSSCYSRRIPWVIRRDLAI